MSTAQTQRVAEFVSELRFDQIPERSARAASDAILDGVGVALAGSTAEQVVNAIGIATSMASGVTSNFGTMSKPLHAGLAARNGSRPPSSPGGDSRPARWPWRAARASSRQIEARHGVV